MKQEQDIDKLLCISSLFITGAHKQPMDSKTGFHMDRSPKIDQKSQDGPKPQELDRHPKMDDITPNGFQAD